MEQMRLLAERHYTGALVLMSGYDARVLASAHAVGQSLGLKVERVLEKPLRVEELEQVFERLQSAEQSLTGERLLEAIAENELVLDFQPLVTRHPKALKKAGDAGAMGASRSGTDSARRLSADRGE